MSNEDQFDDEFDNVDEFDADAEFQSGQSIKDLWRKNPIFKFGVIIVGLVVIIASVNIFTGNEVEVKSSAIGVGQGGSVRGAVGEETTEVYREALETRNQQDFETAVEGNDSFLPVPIDPIQTSVAPVAQEAEEKEDPMAQWKELQEKRLRRQQEENQRRRMMELQNQRALAALPRQQDPNAEARNEALKRLSQSMMEQMALIAKRHEYKQPKLRTVTNPEMYMARLREQQAQVFSTQNVDPRGHQLHDAGPLEEEDPLIEPGQIIYAQTLIEANSDIPAPVLAQVFTGHFKGSRIIGTFTKEEEHLVLTFNTIVKDGKSYSVSGIAVDPDNSLPALATEVDHRYFKRIFLPAASKFIEGVAEAVTETGNTSIVGTDGETVTTETEDLDIEEEFLSGVSEASEIVTDILLEEGEDTEILVRVEAGTPIGIMFIEPVYETNRIAAPVAGGSSSLFGATEPDTALTPSPASPITPAGFSPETLQLVPNL